MVSFVQAQTLKKPSFELKLTSPTQLRNFLFDHLQFVSYELTDKGEEIIGMRHKASWQKAEREGTEGLSVDHLIKSSFHKRREFNLFAVSADVLHSAKRGGNDIASLLVEYKEASTLLNTFVTPIASQLDKHGRIHGQFRPDTGTGRLSSSCPNLQNIPSKDKGLVKSAYTSKYGRQGFILQADYSQIELRVAAALFNEPVMIEAYRNDADLHTLTALDVLELTEKQWKALPDDEKKRKRSIMKRVNFGIIYCGGPGALQGTLKKDNIFVDRKYCEELIDKYLTKREGLKSGIDRLQGKVRKDGYYEAPTGYVRRVPQVFSSDNKMIGRALRQITNFPIQHFAAWMTLFSLILIRRRLLELKLKSKIVVTVHDSIVLDCPKAEVFQVARIVKDTMENVLDLIPEVVGGVKTKWLKSVPIKADLEVGYNWGHAVKIEPEKPHTDTPLVVEGKLARSPQTIKEIRKALEV
jgi:DNA polymerase I-like protein with 3'-5' exonuclease and polymerase domains